MPYLKQKAKAHDKSRKLLLAYEIGSAKMADMLGCSMPTARKKINDPGKLTGDEWLRISKFGHIPIDEIRGVFLS